jgi:hypothetical protein
LETSSRWGILLSLSHYSLALSVFVWRVAVRFGV